jgi:uncharacterized protein YjbI with pentapeptide repeats
VQDPTGGANIYDARLVEADFRDATLAGVSLNRSDLDGAKFGGATWRGVEASTTTFRGADLSGLKGDAANLYFADFSDADLDGAPFSAEALEWATLCRTAMANGRREDRDCREEVDPGPKPVDNRKVEVGASLDRAPGEATVHATVTWNAAVLDSMSAGDIRVLAIDGRSGVPTTLATESIPADLPASTTLEATITERDKLAALGRGNRVVVTATQHPPLARGALTSGSYVTVDTVQPGPGRGRVGSRDCSGLTLGPTPPGVAGYSFCDLAGATLTQAALSGPMRDADLTGAQLDGAGLNDIVFDGSALGGADLEGAKATGVSLIATVAPHLHLPETSVRGAKLGAADLDEADFEGATLSDTTLATSSLRRAVFSAATFDKVDLAYARLAGAQLDEVEARSTESRRSSLFLADLTGATLAGSHWPDDESGQRPWRWATLCGTTLPTKDIDGNRDCPR